MTDSRQDDHERHESLDADLFFEAMREQFLARPLPARRRLPLSGLRSRPHRAWSLPAAGAGMAVATAIAALVIALSAGGGDPAPAEAVTVNSNHTVTIYFGQLRSISKLNTRLAALHTRIRVVPIVRGCVAPVHVEIGSYRASTMHRKPGPAPGPARTLEVDGLSSLDASKAGGPVLTIELGTLPGRTFILPITKSGMLGHLAGIGDGVVAGPAPRCVGDSGLGRK